MKGKPCGSMIVLAVMAGFVAGVVASWLFVTQPVFAQKNAGSAKVIEAQEFRLVDKDGRTAARLTMRGGKVLAEIPDPTDWAIELSGATR